MTCRALADAGTQHCLAIGAGHGAFMEVPADALHNFGIKHRVRVAPLPSSVSFHVATCAGESEG
jgi:hypothetical protein